MEITAIFTDKIEKFKVITQNKTGQVLEGLGEYEKDSIVTVKAKTANSLIFLYWEFNGEKVADTPEYTFTISENVEINPIYEVCSPGLIFEYDSESDSYHVTGYSEVHTYEFDMSIPECYNDGENRLKPVSEIKDDALSLIYNLRKVKMGKAEKNWKESFFW